ncbi:MAG TPA: DedA family protein [Thermoanaerobaculia bacterium]|nr:DedA family protein [Thermoanaerobaculia bacterium]
MTHPLLATHAIAAVEHYLERETVVGVFVLLFFGAFGPSPPEESILLLAGYVVYQDLARFWPIVLSALVAAVLGDTCLYGIGRLLGGNLEKRPWLAKIFPREKIEFVKGRFRRYQFRAVVAGRYVYGLRPVLFFTSGASRMPLWKFLAADSLAAFANAVVWVFLGDRFGGRIGDVLHWAERSETVLLVLAGALIGYFILESILVHAKKWKETSPFVRWATGWKIAAIAGTVLLLVYLEVWFRARGISLTRLRRL